MKVEIDGGKSAVDNNEMTASGRLFQTVPDLSCSNRKGTTANSRQFDGQRD